MPLPELGYEHHRHFLEESEVAELAELFKRLPEGRPGHRLPPAALSGLGSIDRVQALVAEYIGAAARPVRVLLFDKRDGGNWALAWHQDRTIEVQKRVDTSGFGPWTVKQGRPHVAPPVALLEEMITVRLHIDAVDRENGPLLVAPGSHKRGLIPERDILAVVEDGDVGECLADVGDVWMYSTLILHASAKAAPGRRRRVVQIDFSAETLPGGLAWAAAA